MKVQFSIAGVMGLTVVVALGLWSLLYANFLLGHAATTSLAVGGVVGWFVGACYGQAWRGCIAGVLGALLWTCTVCLWDLQGLNRFDRLEACIVLMPWAALGAVPMASTAAVYDRSPRDLIVQPIISCVVVVFIPAIATIIGLLLASAQYLRTNGRGGFPLWIFAYFSIGMLIAVMIAALVGGGYGLVAVGLRSLERTGRRYRNERRIKPGRTGAATAEHKDPATVDPQ